jgi:23S rRNA (cytosine1962-C5)-methyltransferase
VFAEADFLPGLIIDRFVGWPLPEHDTAPAGTPDGVPYTPQSARESLGPPQSWLVIQILTYGMEARRDQILAALDELEPFGEASGIVERSAAKVRELEGLPLREGCIRGTVPASGVLIFEDGLPFAVNIEAGQKTGHFLDQKDNRRQAARYAGGARVLDAFSYSGGFAIHAARAGAASVIAVDSSRAALETLDKNAALNGVRGIIQTVQADVFDQLRGYERGRERFHLILLDPPAVAKTRSTLDDALRGYHEINLRAMRLLSEGGVLVSCSCSQALDDARFCMMIAGAAREADRRLWQLDFRHQAADHPILVGYDESRYLKCGFYRVV